MVESGRSFGSFSISIIFYGIVVGQNHSITILNNATTTVSAEINSTTESSSEKDCPYRPDSPLVKCEFLPMEFISCEKPVDLEGNKTAKDIEGFGCIKVGDSADKVTNKTPDQFGGQSYEEVEKTSVWCTVLSGVHCHGERVFLKPGFPCIKYNGHYFITTLLYSILLGFLGMDRFCLGHTGTAVGKLLTVGGVGVWWIIDVILLVTGSLVPDDGSNWEPFY